MNDVPREMQAMIMARTSLLSKIAQASRAVVPVLLDAGRVNSAKELQELLFELDAQDQAMVEFTKSNLTAILQSLAGGPDK